MGLYIDIHTHHHPSRHLSPQSVGVHPWQADKMLFDEASATVAPLIGECGLDYVCQVDRAVQESVFRSQLRFAEQEHKAVVLHCVRAFEPMMKILKEYTLRAVIFHGFIGSLQQAERAIERGYYLSFGQRTFHSAKTLQALRSIPLDKLFAETDDSPANIEEIYALIARERAISIEDLQQQIEKNYNEIFSQYNE